MVKRLIAGYGLAREDGLESILWSHFFAGHVFLSFQVQKEYMG